jgi:pyruvate/2-oxoglutarate dehydrogenase complex dihydrolipoamide dehydrogenase (E3) component
VAGSLELIGSIDSHMAHDDVFASSAALDADIIGLRANAHPPAWCNPQPVGIYDFVVLGAGPAGMLAARGAATLGRKVALIERDLLGGNRLNVGCVSSKALIRTSRLYARMRDAQDLGVPQPQGVRIDVAAALQRIRHLQARLSRIDSAARLRDHGVDVYFAAAHFGGPNKVKVEGVTLRFKKALIATGARPMVPAIPGLSAAGYLTNENAFDLRAAPPRLLVIGGGPLGCELAQAFCRLGSHVIIAQDEPMFLQGEERDAAQILSDSLARDGVEIHLNTQVVAVRSEGAQKVAELVSDDSRQSVIVDEILSGIGRAPNVENMNLEAARVEYDSAKGIHVNDFLQTTNARIYAAGDVCLDYKFAHMADATARIVLHNALLRGRRRLSALTVPWCTYTDPEIAHVGLYVREARQQKIPVQTFTILMHDVDRAVTDGDDEGFLKIHVQEGTDRILGATVVSRHAGEMINELCLAITAGIGLHELGRVIHAYPTQADAIKMAADAYYRTRLKAAAR